MLHLCKYRRAGPQWSGAKGGNPRNGNGLVTAMGSNSLAALRTSHG